MKKFFSFLLLLLVFSMVLTGCSMPGGSGGTAVCQHRDVNDDSLCDKCSESYTDGKDIVEQCSHRDKDDDNLCDRCDSAYTDGKDVFEVCQHRDADDDAKCDKCGEEYVDGKDIPACQHRDADDNEKCDECGVDYTDGKDIPDAPVCQHRDADDNEKCDECGEDYTDGKDLECAHDFSDWAVYGDNANAPCDQKPLYRVCSVCGGIEWKDGGYENHRFQSVTYDPTCTAEGYDKLTCTVCGFVDKVNYTDMAEHDYKEAYITNASFHWLACKNCDATEGYGEHTADDNGICTVCEEPLAPTEGVVYDVSADGTYAEVIGYTGTATKILIAETYEGLPVKVIYAEAFQNNDTIKQVVIPDSVTSIGDYAFSSCSALTSVTIPDSVTSIGNEAFWYCSRLTSVTIPDSVTSIGYFAFSSCSALTSVTIGNCAAVIGEHAFSSCHSSLYTEYELGRYVKANENPYAILIGVTNKNLSTYKIHEDTKIIAGYAFYECARMTSIAIPDGVRSIGDYAFYYCFALTSVYIEDIAAWCGIAFASYKENPLYYADNLYLNGELVTDLVIPDSVTSIGEGAFYHCTSLTSVVIPDNVTSIGDDAFAWCKSLTSVAIGDNVTSIGYEAFYDCASLTSVYYKGDAAEWSAISIGGYGNSYLTSATRYYYSEEAPTEEGNYWHYDADGKVAVWEN